MELARFLRGARWGRSLTSLSASDLISDLTLVRGLSDALRDLLRELAACLHERSLQLVCWMLLDHRNGLAESEIAEL